LRLKPTLTLNALQLKSHTA